MSLFELEAQVAGQMRGEMRDYVVLSAHLHNLFIHCANAMARKELSRPAAIMAMITARVLGDLRVCQWAAEHGYALQAASVAATVHELSYAGAYIGDSEDRATEWTVHDNERKAYPPSGHKTAITDVLKDLGQSDEHCAQEYDIYRQLCLAKHGNPMLQRNYGISTDAAEHLIEQIPYYSADTVALARFSLFHSERAVWALLTTLLRIHFSHLLDESVVAQFKVIGDEVMRLGLQDGLYEAGAGGQPLLPAT